MRIEDIPSNAQEVMFQLFTGGPIWDGYLVSKAGRDWLHERKLIERAHGWQWLTRAGVEVATDWENDGTGIPRDAYQGKWRRKATTSGG